MRARALYNQGFRDVNTLKHASVSELMAIPGIGPHTAKRIKEQVGGLIKKGELAMLKTERTEQRTLSEF
jgi:ERCC4-type nuclease